MMKEEKSRSMMGEGRAAEGAVPATAPAAAPAAA
jgi:hypothetical protein